MRELMGKTKNYDLDKLIENNHVKCWDHGILAIQNVQTLILWESENPRRPLYLPTDNGSIVKVEHWKRDKNLDVMWNVESYIIATELVANDPELLYRDRQNEITAIVYHIENEELIDNKYISDSFYLLPISVNNDEINTLVINPTNSVKYVGVYDDTIR